MPRGMAYTFARKHSFLMIITCRVKLSNKLARILWPMTGRSTRCGGDHQIPQGGDHQIPKGGDHQVPKGGDHKIPKGGDHKVPKVGDHQAPKVGHHQAPKVGHHKIPKGGPNYAGRHSRVPAPLAARETCSHTDRVLTRGLSVHGEQDRLSLLQLLPPLKGTNFRECQREKCPSLTAGDTHSGEKRTEQSSPRVR